MILRKKMYYVYAWYEGKWIYSIDNYGFTENLSNIKLIDRKSSAKMRVTNVKNTDTSRFLVDEHDYIEIPIDKIKDSIKIAEFEIDIPDPSICF